jgi:hypothetical protein
MVEASTPTRLIAHCAETNKDRAQASLGNVASLRVFGHPLPRAADRGAPASHIIRQPGALENDRHILEQTARDMVDLYGSDAPKMLLERAGIADEHGDRSAARTWREIAATAARLTRRG